METLSDKIVRETLEKIEGLKTLEEAQALCDELQKLRADIMSYRSTDEAAEAHDLAEVVDGLYYGPLQEAHSALEYEKHLADTFEPPDPVTEDYEDFDDRDC